jgi:transposase
MSYEFIQSVGKYQYIYLIDSFRDENGQPRQKRVTIGKVKPKTGEKIYKPWYLEKLRDAGIPVELSSSEALFSVEDIRKSNVRSYGLFYLLDGISKRIGLEDALAKAFPNYWEEIFMLACFMVSTHDPLMYCEDWIEGTESLPVGRMTSQRISELLAVMKPEQRTDFYELWCSNRSEQEYLALDITSQSTYSGLVDDAEWGYNRDHEDLQQVNLCMLMGEISKLPIYQTVYSGSLKDVSTLDATLKKFEKITDGRKVTIVMDKGFYSHRNVTRMLGDDKHKPINFIISMPFTAAFARNQVDSERKDIDCVENTIVINGSSMRAVTKERVWNRDHKVYTHIYYSAKKANGIREALFAHVAVLREAAESEPEKHANDLEYCKYLNIRSSEKQESGYTVSIRNDVIDDELSIAGWVVVISNDVSSAKEAMQIYRDKDVVEKGFLRMKNSIDLGRLRVHSQESMQNKELVGFVASVIMSEINRVMCKMDMYRSYTMRELLKTVNKLRIQNVKGQSIINPVTKEQRLIYEAFELNLPV